MSILLWIGFVVFVLVMLALDLGVFNRKAHVISTREALRWTAFCVLLAVLFTGVVYFVYEHNWLGIAGEDIVSEAAKNDSTPGRIAALKFLSGYIIEQSLSLDNIFVIALIFTYFGVPRIYQHRVLFWGILGALVMRGVMIWAGSELIERFHWIIYVFGVLLLFTAVKMLFAGDEKIEPDRNPLVRLARRFYPVSPEFDGDKFFVRLNGCRAMTPMFVALLVVESTDVLFAVDSIPAIFAITHDPFIVFTSNVFAILNLRSMFFALAGMMHSFRYLKPSLVFLLAYIGVKMLISGFYKIDAAVSLAIIVGILSVGIIASLLTRDPKQIAKEQPSDDVGL